MTIFTPQERRVLLFLLAALLVGSGARVYRTRHRKVGSHPIGGIPLPRQARVDSSSVQQLDTVIGLVERRIDCPTPPDLTKNRIDINRASQRELCLLPGIGTKLAIRIIEYREAHGFFEDAEQLRNVPGIGDKKLSKIRQMVKAGEAAGSQSSSDGGLGTE